MGALPQSVSGSQVIAAGDSGAGIQEHHVHVVPLVPIAVQILEYTLTNYAGQQGDFVFNGIDGRLPVSGWTKVTHG
jgi:hypothetical protein